MFSYSINVCWIANQIPQIPEPDKFHPTTLSSNTTSISNNRLQAGSICMPNTVTNPKITYSRRKRHTLTLLSPYIVFSSLPWLSGMVSQLLMWPCAVFSSRMSSKIVSECLFPISGRCLYRDVIKLACFSGYNFVRLK